MSSPTLHASVTLDRLTFTWPDGSAALAAVSGSFGNGRTGLVGRNGAGKSTLLRLIAGDLAPTSGILSVTGEVAYLPQQLTLDVDRRVVELLGVAAPLDAVRAISAGDVDPAHFDTVGDDWDIEARAEASSPKRASPPNSSTVESVSCRAARPCSWPSRASAYVGPRSRSSTNRPTTSTATPGRNSPRWSRTGRGRSSWSATMCRCSSSWTTPPSCSVRR